MGSHHICILPHDGLYLLLLYRPCVCLIKAHVYRKKYVNPILWIDKLMVGYSCDCDCVTFLTFRCLSCGNMIDNKDQTVTVLSDTWDFAVVCKLNGPSSKPDDKPM